jgi:surfeit locus 1 family protein
LTQARPHRFWSVTAAAVIGIAAGLALGAWQLSRAAQKNAIFAQLVTRRSLPPIEGVALARVPGPTSVIWRPVRLQGRWLATQTVYLDNRQMLARTGFDVLTPLQIEGTDAVVLVQRGWIPRNFLHREQLPQVQTPAGLVEVHGLIAPPPPKLYAFGGPESGPIRQNLDLGEFRARTGLPLLTGLSVQQTGPASEGLLRQWTQPGSGVETHYGYAFQWFALSALIAILYVWFQFITPRRKPAHG